MRHRKSADHFVNKMKKMYVVDGNYFSSKCDRKFAALPDL